jgi:hypothetical protein
MIAFGPVPSRRLGQSLGINNISPQWGAKASPQKSLIRSARATQRSLLPWKRNPGSRLRHLLRDHQQMCSKTAFGRSCFVEKKINQPSDDNQEELR